MSTVAMADDHHHEAPSGLRRWLYGSVTAKVLRSTDCCLLVVRPSVGVHN